MMSENTTGRTSISSEQSVGTLTSAASIVHHFADTVPDSDLPGEAGAVPGSDSSRGSGSGRIFEVTFAKWNIWKFGSAG